MADFLFTYQIPHRTAVHLRDPLTAIPYINNLFSLWSLDGSGTMHFIFVLNLLAASRMGFLELSVPSTVSNPRSNLSQKFLLPLLRFLLFRLGAWT
jgi:hypothetical protein